MDSALLLFANQAQTALALPATSTQTTLTVASGTGSIYPAPSTNQAIKLTIVSTLSPLINEIVLCTHISGDVLTVVRGQEGTTAQAWALGSYVINLMTAGTGNDFTQNYGLENGLYSAVFQNMDTTSGQIINVPSQPLDIVNKAYADSISQGVSKAECQCATTTNITLSGLQTIDGYTTLAGDRVLVKNQTNNAYNGIWVASTTAWNRSSDMEEWTQVPGSSTFVQNGTLYTNTGWNIIAPEVGTIDVTPIIWTQFSGQGTYTAGVGLTLNGTQFSITNTGVTAGSYGIAASVPTLVLNAQGQVTSAVNTPISINADQINSAIQNSQLQNSSVTIGSSTLSLGGTLTTLAGTSISGSTNTLTNIPNSALVNNSVTFNGVNVALGGSGTITAIAPYALTFGTGLNAGSYNGSAAETISLANTSVTAGTYGSAGSVAEFTVNAQGQLTSASTVSIAISNTQVSGLGTMSVQNANSVAITGGSIQGVTLTLDSLDNTPIGANTASTGAFTTLKASGLVTLSDYTGYLYANGSGAITASTTIPNAGLQYSSITINGDNVSLGGSVTVTADLPNSLTFNSSGTGASSPVVFNGATAYTISYNTLGASPLAGSTSLVTLGTITTGVWHGTAIANAYLANSTISGVSLGSNLYSLTIGTGLSGSSYNGSGAVTIALSNTAVTSGSYGSASQTPQITVNAQGQITSITSDTISIAPSQINATIPNSGLTNSSITINGNAVSLGGSTTVTADTPNALTIGTGLSGTSFNGSSPVTIAIANSGVTSGTYGNASTIPVLTINAQGQITSVSTQPINAPSYQGTWNASTNTPTLTSSVGTQGYYYVVNVAGTTNLNGINNWNIGDWAIFSGGVWDKVPGSDTESFTNLTTTNLAVTGLTGYMYANGSGNVTASTTIPTTSLSGTITNAQLANSTISGVSLGSNLYSLTIGTGLTGTSYNGSGAITIALGTTGVTTGSYGSASSVGTFTVNSQGQLTSAGSTSIAIAASQITSGILGGTYGGTGVNNGSNTLTLSGSYTLNQSVASGASPTFAGTNFTSIPNSALINSSITLGSTSVSLGSTVTNITGLTLTNSTQATYETFTPQASNPSASTGVVWYDQNKDSLSYYNSTGYEINIGQQVDQVCYNNTGSTIPSGTAVYLSGGSLGNYPYISPAIATSPTNANMIGVTGQSIANGASGVVVILGEIFSYNTTGMTAGQTLYLSPSTAGALTTTQPSSPFYAVRAGFVVVGGSSTGVIFVSVRNVYTLGSNIISPVSFTAFSTTSNVLQLYGYSSGQVADLIDVWTYSGGTKAFAINNTGAIYAGTWNATAITPAYGGTGATSLTGYVYGNGTGTMTASTTIPTTSLSGTISNAQLANSTISGVSLGSNLNALTIGTGLSGTSYNGSSAITIALANTTVTAGSYTNANITVNAQGQVTSASNGSPGGVTTFSAGTTGFTPNTATTGAITLAGTLNVSNGGTGSTSLSTITVGTASTANALNTSNSYTVAGLTNTGNETISGTLGVTGQITATAGINTPNTFGFKNRIINGAMAVAQRGTSISSGTGSQVYTLDRWASFASGAAVTVAQVAGISSSQYALQITGASSNTLVQLVQKIEQKNSYDLANQTVTFSFVGKASTATTVVVYFSYATVADNFNSTTSITNVSFNLTTTAQTFSTQVSIPVGATTGIQVLYAFNSGLGSGVTATFGDVQLEKGSTATSFDYRPYGTELALCQRYLPAYNATSASVQFLASSGGMTSTTAGIVTIPFQVFPRVPPTGITVSNVAHFNFSDNITGAATNAISFNYSSNISCTLVLTSASIFTVAYRPLSFYSSNASAQILFNGCEL